MVKVKQEAVSNDSAHSLHPQNHCFIPKWMGLEWINPQTFMQVKLICANAHGKNEWARVQSNKLIRLTFLQETQNTPSSSVRRTKQNIILITEEVVKGVWVWLKLYIL